MKLQYRNQAFGLEAKPVRLFAKVTIGASGAPTLVAASSKGITSIVRNSAGDYTVTFGDSFVRPLIADAIVQNATGIAVSPTVGIKTAGTNVNTTGAGTVEIVFSTGGVATDPANGDTIFFEFTCTDSNL